MDKPMFLKTMDLQKTVISCGLSIFSGMQKNAEALLKTSLEQSPWLPAASKTACLYTAECSSKYLENLQLMTEQGFNELERISLSCTKPLGKVAQQKKATIKTAKPAPVAKSPSVTKKTASAGKMEAAKIEAVETAPVKAVAVKTPAAEKIPDQLLISQEKQAKEKQ